MRIPSIEEVFSYDRLKNVWVGPPIRTIFNIEVTGEHNIPENGLCVISSNHRIGLDPLAIQAWYPLPVAYVSKKELFDKPLLGRIMKGAKQIRLDRQKAQTLSEQRKLKAAGAERIRLGMAVGIFPEGTRQKNGKLGRFLGGAASIASHAGVPILPVAITYRWPRLLAIKYWFQSRPGSGLRSWFQPSIYIIVGETMSGSGRPSDCVRELRLTIAALSGQELAAGEHLTSVMPLD